MAEPEPPPSPRAPTSPDGRCQRPAVAQARRGFRLLKARSLRTRFQQALLVAGVVMMGVLLLAIRPLADSHRRNELRLGVQATIDALDRSLAAGAYARDPALVHELAAGLAQQPAVRAVAVQILGGARLDPVLLDKAGDTRAAPAAQASLERRLNSPFAATEQVGLLRVWMDEAYLDQAVRKDVLTVLGAVGALVALSIVLVYVLAQRLLTRPMHQLARALSAVSPGSDARIEVDAVHQDDEIGRVASAANQLLALHHQALQRERGMREEIAAMEARYRGIFAGSAAGLFVLDAAGRLLDSNPALARMMGWPDARPPAAAQANALLALDPQQAGLAPLVHEAIVSGSTQAADLPLRGPGGQPMWVHCVVTARTDADGSSCQVEGALHDITRRKLDEERSRYQAEHDPLTGLRSRAYIEQHLAQALAGARDRDERLTLLFIDLDGFKAVNDRHGHAAGDRVLVEAARRLRQIFRRQEDVLGRLGGDELVVVLPGMDASAPLVAAFAEQLIALFRQPVALDDGTRCQVGASVGAASFPKHAVTAGTLIAAADQAMYAVKQTGKGRFAIAHPPEPMPA